MKFIIYFALFLFSFVSPVQAQTSGSWASHDQRCVANGDVATIQGVECLVFFVLQVIVSLAGIVFLFMFISGGFKYLFSSGEQKAVAAASSTLTLAVIGLVGIIASWLILSFIQTFTGLNITQLIIPG
ncbi:hypothetical protein KKD37_00755 [Patescibacteria group bacterium]|nr:hypothetical protein [Patescibacteria group bacterium]